MYVVKEGIGILSKYVIDGFSPVTQPYPNYPTSTCYLYPLLFCPNNVFLTHIPKCMPKTTIFELLLAYTNSYLFCPPFLALVIWKMQKSWPLPCDNLTYCHTAILRFCEEKNSIQKHSWTQKSMFCTWFGFSNVHRFIMGCWGDLGIGSIRPERW